MFLVQLIVPDPTCSYAACLMIPGKLRPQLCFTLSAHNFSVVHDEFLSKDSPPVCSGWAWTRTFWIRSSLLHRSCAFGWFCCLSLWRRGRDLLSKRQPGSRLSPVVSSQKMSLSVRLFTSFSLWFPSVFGSTNRGPNEMTKWCWNQSVDHIQILY